MKSYWTDGMAWVNGVTCNKCHSTHTMPVAIHCIGRNERKYDFLDESRMEHWIAQYVWIDSMCEKKLTEVEVWNGLECGWNERITNIVVGEHHHHDHQSLICLLQFAIRYLTLSGAHLSLTELICASHYLCTVLSYTMAVFNRIKLHKVCDCCNCY